VERGTRSLSPIRNHSTRRSLIDLSVAWSLHQSPLAYVGADETRLVSRKGNTYRSFPVLCAAIHIDLDCDAVLDGEIVILDSQVV
jgi:hypothetical protein